MLTGYFTKSDGSYSNRIRRRRLSKVSKYSCMYSITLKCGVKLAAMDGIIREVQARSFICEQMSKLIQYLPMLLGYPVLGLAAINSDEFKWPTDICIGIGQSDPLAERFQALCLGILN